MDRLFNFQLGISPIQGKRNKHKFSDGLLGACVILRFPADVARFSFIVQNSLSCLDLDLCSKSMSFDSPLNFCDRCRSNSFSSFVNTEEKCRQLFAPRRSLLYNLNLDLPKGRECSLKEKVRTPYCHMPCCTNPHVSNFFLVIKFYEEILSSFIEYALENNVPKEKIFKLIAKTPFSEMKLLRYLDMDITSQFLDYFYPDVSDFELFRNFLKQIDIRRWMGVVERPEILELVLYYAHLWNITFYDTFDIELIDYCISNKRYQNIGPVLKYCSGAFTTLSHYLFRLRDQESRLAEHIRDTESITSRRKGLLVQVIFAHTDSNLPGLQEAASQALRLIWSSIPDAFLTVQELRHVLEAVLSEERLRDIGDFYTGAVGEFPEFAEPRSLKQLCRAKLRRIFEGNNLWIPDAIQRTGLAKSLQAFLNLEMQFVL